MVFELKKLKTPGKVDWGWVSSVDPDELGEVSTERFLQAVAAQLDHAKLALLNLDTGSDQFAVIAIEPSLEKGVLTIMKNAGYAAARIAAKPLVTKAKPVAKRARGGSPLSEWPDCKDDPSNTWRYFIHPERELSRCLRKWPQAFDIMEGPATSTSTRTEKKSFVTAAQCTQAYVEYYEALKQEGWLQFTAQEHAKELRARAK